MSWWVAAKAYGPITFPTERICDRAGSGKGGHLGDHSGHGGFPASASSRTRHCTRSSWREMFRAITTMRKAATRIRANNPALPNLVGRRLAFAEKDRIPIRSRSYQCQPDNAASTIATPIVTLATPIQSMPESRRLSEAMRDPHLHGEDEKHRERYNDHQHRRQVWAVSPVRHEKPAAAICSLERNTPASSRHWQRRVTCFLRERLRPDPFRRFRSSSQ